MTNTVAKDVRSPPAATNLSVSTLFGILQYEPTLNFRRFGTTVGGDVNCWPTRKTIPDVWVHGHVVFVSGQVVNQLSTPVPAYSCRLLIFGFY